MNVRKTIQKYRMLGLALGVTSLMCCQDVSAMTPIDKALFNAVNKQEALAAIRAGANVNSRDASGDSPLSSHCRDFVFGREGADPQGVIDLLIQQGANVESIMPRYRKTILASLLGPIFTAAENDPNDERGMQMIERIQLLAVQLVKAGAKMPYSLEQVTYPPLQEALREALAPASAYLHHRRHLDRPLVAPQKPLPTRSEVSKVSSRDISSALRELKALATALENSLATHKAQLESSIDNISKIKDTLTRIQE